MHGYDEWIHDTHSWQEGEIPYGHDHGQEKLQQLNSFVSQGQSM
jgi:hypothetical protein